MGERDDTATMRVGLVAPLPPQVGGVTTVATWLLGHQEEIGCEYVLFDLWRPAGGPAGGRFALRAVPRQMRATFRFARWLATAPRVLHYCVSCSAVGLSRDLLLVAIARLRGHRIVAHIHGSEFATSRAAPFVQVPALRILTRLTVGRVALTPWAQKELAAIGVASHCISNPIAIRPRNGIPVRDAEQQRSLRLLFVGAYGRMKGCDTLVDALARARAGGLDATLTFVGKEMYEGEEAALRDRVHRHELESAVEFAGTHRPEQLPGDFAAADVICLPSQREVMPMSLLEGMAHGLPALASAVGGIPDVVEDGRSGVLVSFGNVDELAAGIRRLAEDPVARLEMGREARARALSLTAPEKIVSQWRELYSRTSGATRGRS